MAAKRKTDFNSILTAFHKAEKCLCIKGPSNITNTESKCVRLINPLVIFSPLARSLIIGRGMYRIVRPLPLPRPTSSELHGIEQTCSSFPKAVANKQTGYCSHRYRKESGGLRDWSLIVDFHLCKLLYFRICRSPSYMVR